MDGESDEARWIDTHCHLQDLADYRSSVGLALASGVDRLVCVGTDAQSSRRSLELARELTAEGAALVWASVGVHPHEASGGIDGLEELLDDSRLRKEGRFLPGSVVAIGECGLDYHYDHSPRAVQREVFASQIRIATAHDLALVVHTREAWPDTLAIFSDEGMPKRTVIHCFGGGVKEAEAVLELGGYISISGIVTFKNAHSLREVAAMVPSDRLLVETDSPFLAPVPHRGRPNEPAYVAVVGEAVAAIRGESSAALASCTSRNARAVFLLEDDDSQQR